MSQPSSIYLADLTNQINTLKLEVQRKDNKLRNLRKEVNLLHAIIERERQERIFLDICEADYIEDMNDYILELEYRLEQFDKDCDWDEDDEEIVAAHYYNNKED